jgi:hypothetical protein
VKFEERHHPCRQHAQPQARVGQHAGVEAEVVAVFALARKTRIFVEYAVPRRPAWDAGAFLCADEGIAGQRQRRARLAEETLVAQLHGR